MPARLLGFALSEKADLTLRIQEKTEGLSQVAVIQATSTPKEAEEFHQLIQ